MRVSMFLRSLAMAGTLICPLVAPVAQSAQPPHVELTWMGGATMTIRFNGLTILTDPALGPVGFVMGDPNEPDLHKAVRHRRLTPYVELDREAVDLVLLSHAHEDHLDQTAQAELDRTLPFILPVADVKALEGMGFSRLDGLAWGETRRFDAADGHVSITAIVAHHSRDPTTARRLGVGNGYWLTFTDGDWSRSVYWTGDTLPTDDVVEAARSLGTPDILVANVGGVGIGGPLGQISMGAEDVIALADAIEPTSVVPIHHSTYAFYRQPIDELVRYSRGKPYRLVIAEGTTTLYR